MKSTINADLPEELTNTNLSQKHIPINTPNKFVGNCIMVGQPYKLQWATGENKFVMKHGWDEDFP